MHGRLPWNKDTVGAARHTLAGVVDFLRTRYHVPQKADIAVKASAKKEFVSCMLGKHVCMCNLTVNNVVIQVSVNPVLERSKSRQ